jgi:hypothetical protein
MMRNLLDFENAILDLFEKNRIYTRLEKAFVMMEMIPVFIVPSVY